MSEHADTPEANPDAASIDSIIAALYEAISFEAGKQSDWTRLRGLFLPGGTLIPPRGPSADRIAVLTLENFILRARTQIERDKNLRGRGFVEKEIARRTEQFSSVTHILSTYEGRFGDDNKPLFKGINSIQLVEDGGRWWVASIVWADEDGDVVIPKKYLCTRKPT